MDRINKIFSHSLYQKELSNIREDEESRIYCRHDINHFLSVARLMMILSYEEGLAISKDLIYASALLHDIGRSRQYRDSISHSISSVEISKVILPECDFSEDEINEITVAILSHSKKSVHGDFDGLEDGVSALGRLLIIADKKSRLCFNCDAEKTCKWKKDDKNLLIDY